jgi:hypothetical protein
MSVERWWNPPDATPPAAKFILFFLTIFNETIWRIGDDSVNGVWLPAGKPSKTIGWHKLSLSVHNGKKLNFIMLSVQFFLSR